MQISCLQMLSSLSIRYSSASLVWSVWRSLKLIISNISVGLGFQIEFGFPVNRKMRLNCAPPPAIWWSSFEKKKVLLFSSKLCALTKGVILLQHSSLSWCHRWLCAGNLLYIHRKEMWCGVMTTTSCFCPSVWKRWIHKWKLVGSCTHHFLHPRFTELYLCAQSC
jgi:hypothetical protein